MIVKMLRREAGSRTGITTEIFQAGQTYDVPDALGKTFVSIGSAVKARAATPAAPVEDKEEKPKRKRKTA